MPTEQLGSLLEQWIVDTRDSFKTLPDSPWSATFANKYGQVLTSASDQLERVLSEFNAFIRDLESGQITDQADALFRYIVAMSVAVEEEPVFLPSFSDKCLEILVQDRPFGGLSPFRGIYYAWQLGNIAKGLQSNKRNRYQRVVPGHDEWRSAFDRLETLRKELENDVQLQRDPSYPAYYDSLTATDKGVPIIEASLVRQIEHVKSAIKFGVQRKRRWLGLLPYQCQHSTHFYLSGIRFYWSPVLEERNEPMWTGREHPMDRFCVNSTDSGLVLPSERYGMILPDGGSDACIEELAELVPVGSLFLDLSDMSATSEDARSLRYFENWSRLITSCAYSVVSETSEEHQSSTQASASHKNRSELARATFLGAVRKNPLRTLYFDTGILGSARVAARGDQVLPPIQYQTTIRSVPAAGSLAERFLSESLGIAGDTLEFYISSKDELQGVLKDFTLVPLGESLRRHTSFLWSIRGEASKIAHGFEGSVSQGAAQAVADRAKKHLPVHVPVTAASLAGTALATALSPFGAFMPLGELFALATLGAICAPAWPNAKEKEEQVTAVMQGLRNFSDVRRIHDIQDLHAFR